MNEKPRKIEGVDDGDPVKVKLTGSRYTFIVLAVVVIWLELYGISLKISESNRLRKLDLEIRKEQLDLQRRQFAADSIMLSRQR